MPLFCRKIQLTTDAQFNVNGYSNPFALCSMRYALLPAENLVIGGYLNLGILGILDHFKLLLSEFNAILTPAI